MPVKIRGKGTPFGPFSEVTNLTLDDLSVVVGENGSGKTQLLKALDIGVVIAEIDSERVPPHRISYHSGPMQGNLHLNFRIGDVKRLEEAARDEVRRPQAPKRIIPGIGLALQIPEEKILLEHAEAFAVLYSHQSPGWGFGYNLGQASMGYLRTRYYQERLRQREDSTFDGILRGEFDFRKFPPPWELASEVLEDFGFRIEGPSLKKLSGVANEDLSLRLVSSSTGAAVPPEQLSSGERSLLALAVAQYTSSLGGALPRILLLDESLASLHPSILRKSIQTLRRVFVDRHKICVIVVTHSPTLVAVLPDTAVVLAENRAPVLKLSAISHDRAIGFLSREIPTMRFDLRNRRQVFVEAEHDQYCYSHLYRALQGNLDPEVSLEFLARQRRKDNDDDKLGRNRCVVEETVKMLRESGVTTVLGLVDGDTKSTRTNGVVCLGDGERYAIENYLLDPLLLTLCLADHPSGRKEIGDYTQRDLEKMKPEQLQVLVDRVMAKIRENAKASDLEDRLVVVGYVGGFSLKIPLWALKTRGHNYSEWVVKAYPSLGRYSEGRNQSKEDKLVAAIASRFSMSRPEFLPMSLLHSFQKLQRPVA